MLKYEIVSVGKLPDNRLLYSVITEELDVVFTGDLPECYSFIGQDYKEVVVKAFKNLGL